MRSTRVAVAVVGALFLAFGAVHESRAQMKYELNFVLGEKVLDEDDWEPLEDQDAFAVCSSFGRDDWPVKIAIDVLGSADDIDADGLDIEASTVELDAGVRKIWYKNRARPFIGGGLALVTGEIDVEGLSVDDDGVGAWIGGGVFWRLGRRFNIGFEARVSRAEVDIGAVEVEAGGEFFGLVLGFGSPTN